MSVIFGIRRVPSAVVAEHELLALAVATERFGTDGTFTRFFESIGMGFQPLYTHQRSNLETQPCMDQNGNMLTFDGRLDNHEELRNLLGLQRSDVADSEIVLAAFHRWGEECFSRFVGDWALALWSRVERSLYLARDHAGARTLYFEIAGDTVLWSTYIETFLLSDNARKLDEIYAAAYLGCQPVRDRTPYKGIRAVLPAHYLVIKGNQITRRTHWDWMIKGSITYKSDRAYDEHFLSLFRRAVERRSGPGEPILAQLSGGMDSASIVCMSDHIRSGGRPEELLDTVSFFDDAEPHWNESPYFSRVEYRRGKVGIHQKVSFAARTFRAAETPYGGCPLPGMDESFLAQEQEFERLVCGKQYRAVLSGVGGDEVMGGVPTPFPELADHLVAGKLGRYLKRSVDWCLANRMTIGGVAGASIRFAASAYLPIGIDRKAVPPWLSAGLAEMCSSLAHDDVFSRETRLGLRPSRVANGRTWWTVMEVLPHINPGLLHRLEYRYPYLDRDLITFLFTIPREQLVGPGRRRVLMRRALNGIVPEEILERRRKAFCVRGPLEAMRFSSNEVDAMTADSRLVALSFVKPDEFKRALWSISHVRDPRWSIAMMKTLNFESWLRSSEACGRHFPALCAQKRSKLQKSGANKAGTGTVVSSAGLAR